MNRVSNVILELARLLTAEKSSEQHLPKRLLKTLSWCIKGGVSGAAIYFIAVRLIEYDASLSFSSFIGITSSYSVLFGFAVLGFTLMGFNWGFEVIKWHLLLSKEYNTKWRTAIKGVLSGTTFGVFTPNRFGEFVGRVLALYSGHRIGATVLSFVNSLSQTLATLTFGIIGFFYLLETLAMDQLGFMPVRALQLLLILLWVGSMFVFFRVKDVATFLDRSKFLARYTKHLSVLDRLENSSLNRLYLLSMVRYLTFIAQYVLVFGLLLSEPNWTEVSTLAMLTMFSSMLFSFLPVPDLLMREAIAISYFGLYSFDLIVVSKAVFLVWLINVAFPAAIGAFVLFTYRIFKSS